MATLSSNMTQFDEIARSDGGPVRHHSFYFDDGNVVLEVQGVLFKIRKIFLTKYSPVFESLFRLKPNSAGTEGLSDELPISLQGDDPVDFSRLLQLFYHDKPGSAVNFDAGQWLSVLGLAHKYDMIGIREVAFQGLKYANPPLPPAKQLAFARRYNCDELADTSFQVLATRAEPLSKDEMAQLPLDDLYHLVVAREKPVLGGKKCGNCKHSNCWCLRCNYCGNLERIRN